MSVTAFGGIFLPLTLFVFLFRRTWLLPLLCVAAVLQSPSVADVRWQGQSFGITPFVAVATLIGLDLMRRLPQRPLPADGRLPLVAWMWLAFVAVAILGAALLPGVFAGIPIHTPMAAEGAPPVPLDWTLNHAAQVVNLLLVLVVGCWIWKLRASTRLPRYMLAGVLAAVGVAAVVGLQQRLGWNGVLPLWEAFWASNPGYDQDFRAHAGPVPRVSWPFIEPSYASAWFSAAVGGFIAMFVANRHRHAALLGVVIATFALANSLGATGFLATGLFCVLLVPVLVAVAWRNPAFRGGLAYRLCLGALVFACLGLAGYLVLRNQGLVEPVRVAFGSVLEGHGETMLGDIRPEADRRAVALIGTTSGMGVGMGSHRASSYLVNLVSTVGVAGLVLFLLAYATQLNLLARRIGVKGDTPCVFFLGSGVAGLIAVSIAIPDLNWPAFQMLVLGGFVCAVSREPLPS